MSNNQDFNSPRRANRAILLNQLSVKTFANDRLKRLRSVLTEDASNPNNETTIGPQHEPHQSPVVITHFRQREIQLTLRLPHRNPFVSKDEAICTTSTVNRQNVVTDSTIDHDVSSVQTQTASCSTSGNDKKFFIVPDTEIFVSFLRIVKDIVNVPFTGDVKPVIFVPCMVRKELALKQNETTKTRLVAQDANKFIEKTLLCQSERMKGQSIYDEQKNIWRYPDNKIIACCLQILDKHQKMILLTNDMKLRSKAHLNKIPVCSHIDIMPIVLELNQTGPPLMSWSNVRHH